MRPFAGSARWRVATPALPEVGVLGDVLRTMPRMVVNDHPEGRFVDRGGRVLRLGASPDAVTVLHYAEYLADVPSTVRIRRHRKVRGPHGDQIVVVECLDDENGIVPDERQPTEDYFAVILREYLAMGRALTGTVGDADAEVIDAADIVAFGAAWMGAHLR